MKSRLSLTVDPQVTHSAKHAARLRNQSLSSLVEDLLREVSMADADTKPEPKQTFSQRWAGRLKLERKEGDARFEALSEKYDL